MDAPSEVADFDLPVDADEDVLGLDVPMHDVFLVEVLEGGRHLRYVLGCLGLGEALLLAEMLVEFALGGEFEDEEDPLRVVEVAVQTEDVGVREVRLDFYLAADLLFYFPLLELGLVQDLQSADEARGALFSEVDAAEFSLAEGLPDFEHAEMPLLGGGGLGCECYGGVGEGAAVGGVLAGGGDGYFGDVGVDDFGGVGGGELLEGDFDAVGGGLGGE